MPLEKAVHCQRDDAALSRVAIHERVLDRLADLLLDTDEVLWMLRQEEAAAIRWIEPHLQRAFDEFDTVMRRITD